MKILFIGDSITDTNRNKEDEKSLGGGFAFLIAAQLGVTHPQKFEFINKGVGGDRIVDLIPRWRDDCLNQAPDLVNILVGVNDVWAEHWGRGVDREAFGYLYDFLLGETRKKLPNAQIIICGPFVLEGTATGENFGQWRTEIDLRAKRCQKLAEKYGCQFIGLQEVFNNALAAAPCAYWLTDGVHPSPAGHRLIADKWLREAEFINR